MTDRKVTCVACKSAITEGDIAHSDLEFGGELKATNQPEYTADADTDLVATVGTLDEYTPMVRTTGTQTISGVKYFTASSVPIVISTSDKGFDLVGFTSNTKLSSGETPIAVERHGLVLNDGNGNMVARLWFDLEPGTSVIKLRFDGQIYDETTHTNIYKSVILGTLAP